MDQQKKATMVVLVFFGTLIFSVNYAFATTTGVCANCHVMHAQETDTTPSTTTYGNAGAGGTGGNDMLLEAGTCLGCHGKTASIASGAPIVEHSSDVTTTTQLAGGDFYWEVSGDRFVHNVTELINTDDIWDNQNPPGWDATHYTAHDGGIGTTWTNQLTCAGVYGCHGTHVTAAAATDMDAMSGSHHNNISTEAWRTGADIGNSYRFLLGIKGFEVDNYEKASVVTNVDLNHNIYYGEDRTTDSVSDTATISYFCGQCHGAFHSDDDGGTGVSGNGDTITASSSGYNSNTWVRHPVDFAMPLDGEYASYGGYDYTVPVASSITADTTMTTGALEDRIITCLTCHLAHGSKYEHLLRFDDQTMVLGTGVGTGCFVCHTAKD